MRWEAGLELFAKQQEQDVKELMVVSICLE